MELLVKLLCLLFVLFPSLFAVSSLDASSFESVDISNLAKGKLIEANATCGEGLPEGEQYCRLANHVRGISQGETHCKTCRENDHKAYLVIDPDEQDTWWQSPSLARGSQFHYVTLTLDLKQVYRVSYISIKSAFSPLPGNWILERSIDGATFTPWMYFVLDAKYCREAYGMRHVDQRTYRFTEDDEVICTSAYDKASDGKIETAELNVPLSKNRPGSIQRPGEDTAAFISRSNILTQFTIARYIRFRFQKIATFYGDKMIAATAGEDYGKTEADATTLNRLYYSIKNIEVGGSCVCFGHSNRCPWIKDENKVKCECSHNTEGDSCERCEPMFNQLRWQAGKPCVRCQCHGKADSCVFNQTVANEAGSKDFEGKHLGGGVCQNCRANTTGVNCELCLPGFYRVASPFADRPCMPCSCDSETTEQCHQESVPERNITAGECKCRAGFTGENCAACALGYQRVRGQCVPCPCSLAGSEPGRAYSCNPPCNCKAKVERLGTCDRCMRGFYNLQAANPQGCSPCFCFGVDADCSSARGVISSFSKAQNWIIQTTNGSTYTPHRSNFDYPVVDQEYMALKLPGLTIDQTYYWRAPEEYLRDLHTAYGGEIVLVIGFEDTSAEPIFVPDQPLVRIESSLPGGASLTYYVSLSQTLRSDGQSAILRLPLVASDPNGPRIPENGHWMSERGLMATEAELRSRLVTATSVQVLAKYSVHQKRAELRQLGIPVLLADPSAPESTRVENCTCRGVGYSGLSCEACQPGFRRVANQLLGGFCARCDCNGQSDACDAFTGACIGCSNNTEGERCERCRPGFYGNPPAGVPCRRCECPSSEWQFASTCQLSQANRDSFVCENCAPGHMGDRCEKCRFGFYGNPIAGIACRPCNCSGNSAPGVLDACDTLTGQCKACSFNSTGRHCEACQPGFYGRAADRGCQPCGCFGPGSQDADCHPSTGICRCLPNFVGAKCGACQAGRGNLTAGCPPCRCHPAGSKSSQCDPLTGLCACLPGVAPPHCEACQPNHHSMQESVGCYKCDCSVNGILPCDQKTGACICGPRQQGRNCDCKPGHFWNAERTDCLPCACSSVGSYGGESCNLLTGQCSCKPGVGGRACDSCLDNFWGLGSSGCTACAACFDGQRCDKLTGQCNCPPNTRGHNCKSCVSGHWSFDPVRGCLPCGCHSDGSATTDCDLINGSCTCRPGFTGDRCDRCQAGFYGFPSCTRCRCSLEGVLEDKRDVCMPDGSCYCKPEVTGRECLDCVQGTFARLVGYSRGCVGCYCSVTNSTCRSDPGWQRTQALRRQFRLSIDRQPGEYGVPADSGAEDHAIHGNIGYLDIPLRHFVSQVDGNQTAMGDLLHEFGSEVAVVNVSCTPSCGQLNNRAKLKSLGPALAELLLTSDGSVGREVAEASVRVVLTEDHWSLQNGQPLSRMWLMHFLKRTVGLRVYLFNATESPVVSARVSVTVFANKKTGLQMGEVESVERCDCPHPYVGLSCQRYEPGYFPRTVNYSNLLPPREKPQPCPCNGHSMQCSLNGTCMNCAHNTTGTECEVCLPGYYRLDSNDKSSPCLACACPSEMYSYSSDCIYLKADAQLLCIACRNNTYGNRCETCAPNFFGDPTSGVPCQPCGCKQDGIQPGTTCHPITGQCQCLPSIEGRDCSNCKPEHVVSGGRCVSCNDTCTGTLIERVKRLTSELGNVRNVASKLSLAQIGRVGQLETQLNDTERAIQLLQPGGFDQLRAEVESLTGRCWASLNQSLPIRQLADDIKVLAETMLNTTRGIFLELDPLGQNAANVKVIIEALISGLTSNRKLQELDRDSKEIESRVSSAWKNRLQPYISALKSQLGSNRSAEQLERLRSILANLNDTVSMNAPFLRAYLNGIIALSRTALGSRDRIEEQLRNHQGGIEVLLVVSAQNQRDIERTKDLVKEVQSRLNTSDIELNGMNVTELLNFLARLRAAREKLDDHLRRGSALSDSELNRLRDAVDKAVRPLQNIHDRLKDLVARNATEVVDPWAAIKQEIDRLKQIANNASETAHSAFGDLRSKLPIVNQLKEANRQAEKKADELRGRLNDLTSRSAQLKAQFEPKKAALLAQEAEALRIRIDNENVTYQLPTVSATQQMRVELRTNRTRGIINQYNSQFRDLQAMRDSLNISGPTKAVSLTKIEQMRRKLQLDLSRVRSLLHTVRGSLNKIRTPASTIVEPREQHCVRQVPLTMLADQQLRTLSFRFQMFQLNSKDSLPKEILASVFNPLTKSIIALTVHCAKHFLVGDNDEQSNCNARLHFGTGLDLSSELLTVPVRFSPTVPMWYEVTLDLRTSHVTLNYLYDGNRKASQSENCRNEKQFVSRLGSLVFTTESLLYQGGLPPGEEQLQEMFSDYRNGTLFMHEVLVNNLPLSAYDYTNYMDPGCASVRLDKKFPARKYPIVRQQTYSSLDCIKSFSLPITENYLRERAYGFDGFSYFMLTMYRPFEIGYFKLTVNLTLVSVPFGQETVLALLRINEMNKGNTTHLLTCDGALWYFYTVDPHGKIDKQNVSLTANTLLQVIVKTDIFSATMGRRFEKRKYGMEFIDLYIGGAPKEVLRSLGLERMRGYRGCLPMFVPDKAAKNVYYGASVGTVMTSHPSINCSNWVQALHRDAALVATVPIEIPAEQLPDLEHWSSVRLRFSGGPVTGGYKLFSLGNMLSLEVTADGRLRLKSSPTNGIRRMRRMRRRRRRRMRSMRRLLRLRRLRRSIEKVEEGREFLLTGPSWKTGGRAVQVELQFQDTLDSRRKVLLLIVDGNFIGGLYLIGKFGKLRWTGAPDGASPAATESLVRVHQFLVECRISGRQNETNLLQLLERMGAQLSDLKAPINEFFRQSALRDTIRRPKVDSCDSEAGSGAVRVFANAADLLSRTESQPVTSVSGYLRAMATPGSADSRLLRLSSADGSSFVELLLTSRRAVRINVELGGSELGNSNYAPVDLQDTAWHKFSLERQNFSERPSEHLKLTLDGREMLLPVRMPNLLVVTFANWTGCLAGVQINGAPLDTGPLRQSIGRQCPCRSRLLPAACISASDFELAGSSGPGRLLERPLVASDPIKAHDELIISFEYKVSEKHAGRYGSQYIDLISGRLGLSRSTANDLSFRVQLQQDPNSGLDSATVEIQGSAISDQLPRSISKDFKSSRRSQNALTVRLKRRNYESYAMLYVSIENGTDAEREMLTLTDSWHSKTPLGSASISFTSDGKVDARFYGCLIGLKLTQLMDSTVVAELQPDWRAVDTLDNHENLMYLPERSFYST